MSNTPNKNAPTNNDILATWIKFEGELAAVVEAHNLTPAQVLAFAKDQHCREVMDAYEELMSRRHRIVAMHHQTGAAEGLSKAMFETENPAERRRAASALARLTVHMSGSKNQKRTTAHPLHVRPCERGEVPEGSAQGGEGASFLPPLNTTISTLSPLTHPQAFGLPHIFG